MNDAGSLCSLGIFHLALENTIKSKSEMRTLDYETMKALIINQTMKTIQLEGYDKNKPDFELLSDFTKGKAI